MVAVLVHEVIGIAFVLLPHFLHDALHVFLCEVRAAQDYGFSTEPQESAFIVMTEISIPSLLFARSCYEGTIFCRFNFTNVGTLFQPVKYQTDDSLGVHDM